MCSDVRMNLCVQVQLGKIIRSPSKQLFLILFANSDCRLGCGGVGVGADLSQRYSNFQSHEQMMQATAQKSH